MLPTTSKQLHQLCSTTSLPFSKLLLVFPSVEVMSGSLGLYPAFQADNPERHSFAIVISNSTWHSLVCISMINTEQPTRLVIFP